MKFNFLGMPLDEARKAAGELGLQCRFTEYLGLKPYKNADIARIVRVNKVGETEYQLIYSYFLSVPKTESQGS